MTGNTQEVHWEKGSVKENVGQDEMDLTQPLIHRPAEHLGKPIVDRSEQREDDSGDNVMEVGHDEIGIMWMKMSTGVDAMKIPLNPPMMKFETNPRAKSIGTVK